MQHNGAKRIAMLHLFPTATTTTPPSSVVCLSHRHTPSAALSWRGVPLLWGHRYDFSLQRSRHPETPFVTQGPCSRGEQRKPEALWCVLIHPPRMDGGILNETTGRGVPHRSRQRRPDIESYRRILLVCLPHTTGSPILCLVQIHMSEDQWPKRNVGPRVMANRVPNDCMACRRY